ncbi:MAG: N-terminal phage integrase SAM-like domain-containing protein, partial [Deinococcota bacterium]|nr:N-terminal phage integrase SAM-like domain-containing protein [Deinococcota bacterium]
MARRSAGEGSVFQRSGKSKRSSWVAEIAVSLPDGSRKTITGYGTTQKEAKLERERKVKEAMAAASLRTRWTVGQYLDHFLEQCEARVRANTLSIRTYSTYETGVRVNIKPRLGRIPLERLQPHQVQEWITSLLGEKSAATTRKARATLHTALEAAVDWGMLTKNPIPKRSGIQERSPE